MDATTNRALSRAEERKRALIDATAALVLTMLLWPFPVARAVLTPLTNVLMVLATWSTVNVIYHVVCARVWRRTAAMYLLGYSLCDARSSSDGCDALENRTAIRWGVVAGLLVVVTVFSPRIVPFVRDTSGAALRE